jgi:hypothetical protein
MLDKSTPPTVRPSRRFAVVLSLPPLSLAAPARPRSPSNRPSSRSSQPCVAFVDHATIKRQAGHYSPPRIRGTSYARSLESIDRCLGGGVAPTASPSRCQSRSSRCFFARVGSRNIKARRIDLVAFRSNTEPEHGNTGTRAHGHTGTGTSGTRTTERGQREHGQREHGHTEHGNTEHGFTGTRTTGTRTTDDGTMDDGNTDNGNTGPQEHGQRDHGTTDHGTPRITDHGNTEHPVRFDCTRSTCVASHLGGPTAAARASFGEATPTPLERSIVPGVPN